MLAIVGAVVGWLLGRSGLKAQLKIREDELQAEREQADRLRNDAARLPDAVARLSAAEGRSAQLEREFREASSEIAASQARLEETVAGRTALQGDLASLRTQFDELQAQLQSTQLAARTSDATAQAIRNEAEGLRGTNKELTLTLDGLREQLRELSIQLAGVTAERDSAIALVQQSKAYLDQAQDRMRTVFVEAASKVFDEKSAVLDRKILSSTEISKQQLEATLKPFSDNVTVFQQKLEAFETTTVRESAKLEGAITHLRDLNTDMAKATESLATALKGNAKVRGDWGEMILDQVLIASGLEEGVNYRKQDNARDDDGKRHVPDVIVDLPDGRQVVIDSKVNLVDWAAANSIDVSPEDYRAALMAHAAALRRHMVELSDKNYPKILGGQTLELTVLFVPIEGALSAALSVDRHLQTDALKRRIAFATPNTLMSLLKVVDQLWTREKIQSQVDNIRTEANKLLDSLTNFLTDFHRIDKKIVELSDTYAATKNKLSDSQQSVLKRAGRLIKAGIRGNKKLHEDLLEAADEDPADTSLLPALEGSAVEEA
ncbi:DNA recombination protein RmuC [Lysobacter sp. MMG2]|uniref:DNA recombination protein RmuC n=1 Tax=Lysobacter sp. MMG2 TaxID=2801338 RepID=UPI001C236812|nr:DNA recombination protein RmuC [Lysobacter sp. MMG2]